MQTATRTTYQQQQQQQPMKEHTRQTKKQKLEQRITPEVAQIVFIYKGQDGLSYINTRNCSAGNGDNPLFMVPGGLR